MKKSAVSSSSTLILRSQVFLSLDPARGHLVSEEATRLSLRLLEALGVTGYRRKAKNPAYRRYISFLERLAFAGIILHYTLRKNLIEKETRKALEHGIKQVVNLGAGFDSLAYRLHKDYPDVQFIELDRPQSVKIKKDALTSDGGIEENLLLKAIDFEQYDLLETLSSIDSFTPQAPTLFIAEGVTMYLTEPAAEQLFTSVRTCAGEGSRFFFTFMEPRNTSKDTLCSKLWQYLKREPFSKWAKQKDALPEFLKTHGFTMDYIIMYHDLQKDFLNEKDYVRVKKMRGDNVCLCSVEAPSAK